MKVAAFSHGANSGSLGGVWGHVAWATSGEGRSSASRSTRGTRTPIRRVTLYLLPLLHTAGQSTGDRSRIIERTPKGGKCQEAAASVLTGWLRRCPTSGSRAARRGS